MAFAQSFAESHGEEKLQQKNPSQQGFFCYQRSFKNFFWFVASNGSVFIV
jgi:hypothetical protein